MKRTLPFALLAALLSLTVLAPASLAAKPKAAGLFNDCGIQAVQMPTRITQYCADAGAGVINISWTSWVGTAVGTGTYYINGCDPTCIAGKTYKSQVEVTLSNLHKIHGKMFYTYVMLTPLAGRAFTWPPKMKPVPTKVNWTTELWRG